jgi:hypothetical protein
VSSITKLRLNVDYLLGAMVAIPFGYPKEPLYWFALSAFLLVIPRVKLDKEARTHLLAILGIWVCVLFSNLLGQQSFAVSTFSIVGTLLTFSLFIFRYGILDIEEFISGFLMVITVYVMLTFLAFVVLKPYLHGSAMFVSSTLRMWAEGYLIEWPNVFCVFLCLGFYIRWIRGQKGWAFLTMTAALMTTSRIALAALVIYLLFTLLRSRRAVKLLLTFILPLILITILTYLNANEEGAAYVENRLFKIGDRMHIFDLLYDIYVSNPFGIGNVEFKDIDTLYVSYHSSFLKVIVRYGFFGFLLFLFLIKPKAMMFNFKSKVNAPIVFLIFISIVQDMLFHMHLLIFYSAFLYYRETTLGLYKARKTDA